jgi:hypothetical protein
MGAFVTQDDRGGPKVTVGSVQVQIMPVSYVLLPLTRRVLADILYVRTYIINLDLIDSRVNSDGDWLTGERKCSVSDPDRPLLLVPLHRLHTCMITYICQP